MKNNILRSVLCFGLAVSMGAQTFASALSSLASIKEKIVSYDVCDDKSISVIKHDGSPQIWYFYDSKKQLIRENNAVQNRTILYSYDEKGNILNKKIYSFSNEDLSKKAPENVINYSYNNSGEMISYNGLDITYNKLGNPIKYYNGWNFEWENDKLKKASSSDMNIEYFYGEDGRRVKKTVNGETINFNFNDIEDLTQNDGENTFKWYIPESVTAPSFNYKGSDYRYIFDAQSNVVGIRDKNNALVASYTYDSWGKLISMTDENGNDISKDKSHIGYINPLRYRGYYYDSETKLYYLNYRYYDPETGRFLSKDDQETDDYGLYVYCMNNPVNMVDYDGHEAVTLAILMGIGAADVVLLAAAVSALMVPMLLLNPGLNKVVDEAINWAVHTFTECGAVIAAQFKKLSRALCNAIANLAKGYNIYLIKASIPSKLKTPDGKIDLGKFDNPNGPLGPKGSGRGLLGPLSYYILKDTAEHGDSRWKLFNSAGQRIASLAADGKILRK